MTVQHWSREAVTQEILRIQSEGGDLRHGEISARRQRLVSAAVRYFGSWGAAVFAAGINYNEIRRQSQDARSAKVTKWSREAITDNIRRISEAGEQLSASTVRSNHPALFSAAVSSRYYGSWRNALTSAGIDYDEILAQSRTSCTTPRDVRGMRTVIRRLHVLGRSAEQLSENEAQSRYPRLFEKASVRFGSWKAAVDAAFGPDGGWRPRQS